MSVFCRVVVLFLRHRASLCNSACESRQRGEERRGADPRGGAAITGKQEKPTFTHTHTQHPCATHISVSCGNSSVIPQNMKRRAGFTGTPAPRLLAA